MNATKGIASDHKDVTCKQCKAIILKERTDSFEAYNRARVYRNAMKDKILT